MSKLFAVLIWPICWRRSSDTKIRFCKVLHLMNLGDHGHDPPQAVLASGCFIIWICSYSYAGQLLAWILVNVMGHGIDNAVFSIALIVVPSTFYSVLYSPWHCIVVVFVSGDQRIASWAVAYLGSGGMILQHAPSSALTHLFCNSVAGWMWKWK